MIFRTAILVSFLAATVAAFVPVFHQRRGAATTTTLGVASTSLPTSTTTNSDFVDEISADHPLKVLIAGGGVGGLALAKTLSKNPHMEVVVLERTDQFKRFGGPIQLASNALQVLKEMDETIFNEIMEHFTFTGDKENGIKDGIRTEWYAKFDLCCQGWKTSIMQVSLQE